MILFLLALVACAPEPTDTDASDPHASTTTPCERVLQLGEFDPALDYWVSPFEEGLEYELTMTYVVDGAAVRQPAVDYRIDGGWITCYEVTARRCELTQWEGEASADSGSP